MWTRNEHTLDGYNYGTQVLLKALKLQDKATLLRSLAKKIKSNHNRCRRWNSQQQNILHVSLTHFRLNKFPHIMEESNFSLRYARLCVLDIPRETMLDYLQTV